MTVEWSFAAKTLAYLRETGTNQLTTKIHGDLTRTSDSFMTLSTLQIADFKIEIGRNLLLNGFDGQLAVLCKKKLFKVSRAKSTVISTFCSEAKAAKRMREPSSSLTLDLIFLQGIERRHWAKRNMLYLCLFFQDSRTWSPFRFLNVGNQTPLETCS